MARTRKALRLDDGVGALACGGRGTHLGMDVSWSLTFDASAQNGGAYWEGAEGEHMSYRWGFDGDDDVAAPTCAWEVDTYGLPIATCIVGCDTVQQVDLAAHVARNLERMDEKERATLRKATKAHSPNLEWYKEK